MWSQHSKEYGSDFLPGSKLTIWDYGCYLCSICSLANTKDNPAIIAKKYKSSFKNGEVISKVLAINLGLKYLGVSKTQPKDKICIGVTNHYKKVGFPTHFFLMFNDFQADPLDEKTQWRERTYDCFEYRLFDGIVLEPPKMPQDTPWIVPKYLSTTEQLKRLRSALKRSTGETKRKIERAINRLSGIL